MSLSPKQRAIAAYWGSPFRWTLVSGPMGSGKTHPGTLGLALGLSRYGGAEACLVSKSWPQLKSILYGELQGLIGEPVIVEDDGSVKLKGANGMVNRLRCFAAQDKRAEPRIRGFNFVGGLIDEMVTLPLGILAAVNARCRVGEARICGLTNPDGPLHPVKKHFFDKADDISAQVVATTLYDNPSLHPSYIASLKAHYQGHMYERMVMGRWAAATGLVYPRALEFSSEAPDEEMAAYDVCIDVGESSVTAAILFGRSSSGRTWALDEWVFDHQERGQLSEERLVAELREAFGGFDISAWMVDPAAKSFRMELARQLGPAAAVGKAENDWTDGVQEVNHWFASDGLRIWGDRCPTLMETVGALVYDEAKSEQGEDVAVKVPDHLTDILRYYVLTRAIQEHGGRKIWLARKAQMREDAP